jgi:hypothetical protein
VCFVAKDSARRDLGGDPLRFELELHGTADPALVEVDTGCTAELEGNARLDEFGAEAAPGGRPDLRSPIFAPIDAEVIRLP